MELTTKMVADAAHSANNKLYVLGGQWDRITTAQFPVQHPTMAVVLVFRVEYSEAPRDSNLLIELTYDGEPVGPKAAGRFSFGHAPGLKHGAPQFAPIAITFNNIQFDKAGRYEWTITVDDDVLGHIPLELVQTITIPALPGTAPPPAGQ